MPEEDLKVTIDKFTFLIPRDLFYNEAGVWVKLEGNRARLGLTDFAQQHSGDVAFAKVRPVGTKLESGDEFAEIETVKVNVSFPSPVNGNNCGDQSLPRGGGRTDQPGSLRQGLAGGGGACRLGARPARLLDAKAYAALVKDQAEAEVSMKEKVLIVPCSGIGKSLGSVAREGAYIVTEDLCPERTQLMPLALTGVRGQ